MHFRTELNTFVQTNTLSPRITCSSTVTFMLHVNICRFCLISTMIRRTSGTGNLWWIYDQSHLLFSPLSAECCFVFVHQVKRVCEEKIQWLHPILQLSKKSLGGKKRKSLLIDCHVLVTAKLMCGLTNILSSCFPSHPVVCLWIIFLNFQAICKIGKQCIVKDLTTFLFACMGQQVYSISENIFPFLLVFMLLKVMEYEIKKYIYCSMLNVILQTAVIIHFQLVSL